MESLLNAEVIYSLLQQSDIKLSYRHSGKLSYTQEPGYRTQALCERCKKSFHISTQTRFKVWGKSCGLTMPYWG